MTGFLFFFFNDSDIFLSIWILIITSLAIHYFQNVFRGFSILVYRCLIAVLFFTLPHARDSLSRSPAAYIRLTEKRWKIAPVLQIQASSMKLRIHGSLFLVFLHIKMDYKNKLFFYNHTNIQIRRFLSELVESKNCGKDCLIIIRIGTNTALLAFTLGM